MHTYIARYFFVMVALVASSFTPPEDTPQDFLSKEFHQERREQLRKLMPANSVAVFFANPVRNRANDVEYHYHQDPDFYYLTGYTEPHAMLLVFSTPQKNASGETYNEILYVQPRNPQAEMWTGRRLGTEGVTNKLGFKMAYDNTAFATADVDFSRFDNVFFMPFYNDVRDEANLKGDLYDLISQFKQKVQYPENYKAETHKLYDLIKQTKPENSVNAAETIRQYQNYYEALRNDKLLSEYGQAADEQARQKVAEKIPALKINGYALEEFMTTLRQTKTEAELKLLRKAINISAVAQIEVAKAMHPGMSEMEVQGIHEFIYKKYGAEYEGYPSIVGAGNNGCVLHYIENNKTKLSTDLVLMDVGAEYHGYTADVTRTIPASGKFTAAQKQIYDLVYQAQEAAFKMCVKDSSFRAPDKAARAIINKGLKQLGIIKDENENHRYFPHGTSHYLGLDVHDRGTYGPLQPGDVITVEPGIYIPEGSNCDKKWWGIAVRIEDDILIKEDGWENLSAMAPRKSAEIEALMAKKSVLNNLSLPKLD
jgi:Xaa-Pro aminopeptidase